MSSVASPVETSDQAILLSHLHAGTVGDTRGDVAVCDTRMLDTCFKEYFHANTLELIASGAFALSRVVRALNRESFRMDEASLSRHLFMVLSPPACTQITLQKMQGRKRHILTYVAPDGGSTAMRPPPFIPPSTAMRPPPSSSSSAGRHGQGARNLVKTASVPAHGTTSARGRPLATGGGLTAAPVASLSTPTLPLTDSGVAAPLNSGHDKIASAPAHGASTSASRALAVDHGVPCFGDDDHGDVEGAYFLSGDFAASMAIGAASALSGAHKTASVPAHGTKPARGRPLATGSGLTAAPVASPLTPTLPLTDSGAAAPSNSSHSYDKIASVPAHGTKPARDRPLATGSGLTAAPAASPLTPTLPLTDSGAAAPSTSSHANYKTASVPAAPDFTTAGIPMPNSTSSHDKTAPVPAYGASTSASTHPNDIRDGGSVKAASACRWVNPHGSAPSR